MDRVVNYSWLPPAAAALAIAPALTCDLILTTGQSCGARAQAAPPGAAKVAASPHGFSGWAGPGHGRASAFGF